MPEFVITQPEIYEGDSFAEYGPIFLKGWGLLFAVVTVFGFSWKLTGITRVLINLYPRKKVLFSNR